MGTNFYLYDQPPCEKCGRPFKPKHIGKSSAGWCFTLHVEPDEGIHDLGDWRERWAKPAAYIENEYGDRISPEEMDSIITKRGPGRHTPDEPDPWSPRDYEQNYAVPGPNGLVRHRIGRFCVGHGEGTWDLVVGEFC